MKKQVCDVGVFVVIVMIFLSNITPVFALIQAEKKTIVRVFWSKTLVT
ncbi:hypothetical protein [Brochothrix thermosphacta]|nr:hypothetical protein [Brochothrix thermosphacta]